MNKSITEQLRVVSDKWKANESVEQESVQGEGRLCSETCSRKRLCINMPRLRSGCGLEDLPMSHL
jgi:hypothetical protein